MKAGLIREKKWPGRCRNRSALRANHFGHQSGAASGGQFGVQQVRFIAGREKQVAVHAGEIAIDFQLFGNRLDAIDRGGVTLGSQERAALAVPFFNFGEAVVDGVGEVGRRHLSHSAGQRAVVENDDTFARLGKQVAGRQSCDAAADDADVGLNAFGQLPRSRHLRFGPDRLRIGKRQSRVRTSWQTSRRVVFENGYNRRSKSRTAHRESDRLSITRCVALADLQT